MLKLQTSFPKFIGLVVLPLIFLSSCCESDTIDSQNPTRWEIPFDLKSEMEDTTAVNLKELKIKFGVNKVIDGVKDYSIWIGDERIYFYTYNDDVFLRILGKGENSVYLNRGNYNVLVGDTDEMMLYTVSTLTWSRCSAPYINPDIPLSGIRLLHCEEHSGINTGEIKLGTDIPKYSLLKFTLFETESGAVLKRVVLER